MANFKDLKQGDRVRYIGNDTPELKGIEGVVQQAPRTDSNVDIVWDSPKLPIFRPDNSTGVYCRNVEKLALQPRIAFIVDESRSLDQAWSTLAPKPFMPYKLIGVDVAQPGVDGGNAQRAGFVDVNWPHQYAKHKDKLTLDNQFSEAPSTYKSMTDGNIPLSFKGRHLMQRLRTATMAAIHFGDWHVFGEALSHARAAIAQRMGELESRLASAEDTNAQLHAESRAEILRLEADLKKYKDFAAYRLNRMNELKREITKLNETVKANEDFIQLQGSRLRARLEQVERIREVCNNVSSIDP